MNWDEAINIISPHVVKIATPTGYGTGFLACLKGHGRESARDHGAFADDESPCEDYEGAGMNPPGPAKAMDR